MSKQRNQAVRNEASAKKSESGLAMILTGVVCLGAGLGIGYYFGSQAAVQSPPAAPMSSQMPQGSLPDPSEFMANEAGLKAAAAQNPSDVGILVRLGNLYYDNGKFREAIDWYGRALALQPNDISVRTDRGTSYWNLGDADAAITEFNLSLQINPTHAQTLYNLGVVYLHGKKNAAQARQTWEKLLATNPGYPDRPKLEQQLAQLTSTTPSPQAPTAQKVEDLLQQLKK